MGIEYKIETYDVARVELSKRAQEWPEFLRIDDYGLHFSIGNGDVSVTLVENDAGLVLTQHVACRETDALFGLVVRNILSLNDHVVISEL